MKYKKKPVGVFVIGFAISLFLAVLPLLIFGDNSITIIFISKYFQKILRKILLPSLFGCILGIILGLLFPVRVWGETIAYVYAFNLTLFLIIISAGIFISLVVLGTIIIKNS